MDAGRASPGILAICCLLASALLATPADARGHRGRGFHHHHHRGAVFLGFGFGCCGYPYYRPYYPPYYRSYYPPVLPLGLCRTAAAGDIAMDASDDDFERAAQLAALISSMIGGCAWGFAVIFESLDRAGLVSRTQALEVIEQALDRIEPGQGGVGGGAVLRKAAMLLREDAMIKGIKHRSTHHRQGARGTRKTRS